MSKWLLNFLDQYLARLEELALEAALAVKRATYSVSKNPTTISFVIAAAARDRR